MTERSCLRFSSRLFLLSEDFCLPNSTVSNKFTFRNNQMSMLFPLP